MRLMHYIYEESFHESLHPTIDSLECATVTFSALIDHITEKKEKIYLDNSFYSTNFFQNDQVYQWLFERREDGMDETRNLLIKCITISQDVSSAPNEYQLVKQRITASQPINDTTLLCLHEINGNPSCIHKKSNWKDACLYYLEMCLDPEEFIDRAKVCFQNLYFHERVPNSLRTLRSPLSENAKEIVHHLNVIDYEASEIHTNFHSEGDQGMLDRLSVPAAPERNPDVVRRKLTFSFDDNKGQKVNIKCGPHTKINGQGRVGNTEFLFDRIYFGWGDVNIQDGKILIAHIGRHRD